MTLTYPFYLLSNLRIQTQESILTQLLFYHVGKTACTTLHEGCLTNRKVKYRMYDSKLPS